MCLVAPICEREQHASQTLTANCLHTQGHYSTKQAHLRNAPCLASLQANTTQKTETKCQNKKHNNPNVKIKWYKSPNNLYQATKKNIHGKNNKIFSCASFPLKDTPKFRPYTPTNFYYVSLSIFCITSIEASCCAT